MATQQAQKKELELKHLNALKTFDEVHDSFVAVTALLRPSIGARLTQILES